VHGAKARKEAGSRCDVQGRGEFAGNDNLFVVFFGVPRARDNYRWRPSRSGRRRPQDSALASANALARPIPREAPVTGDVFPESVVMTAVPLIAGDCITTPAAIFAIAGGTFESGAC
jgi:hypothetical protein